MLGLCEPGEDPHSFMGASINHIDYRDLIRRYHLAEAIAELQRKVGKVGNLCVAEGTIVLTDRGPCSIEYVRCDDLVWDGVGFVPHDGVVCSGTKPITTYMGLTATPTHDVSVKQEWVHLDEAQRMGWTIDRACSARDAFRIMGGVARRAIREVCRVVRTGAMRLWARARGQPALHGDWTIGAVQSMCVQTAPSTQWRTDRLISGGPAFAEARQRMVPTMRQSEGSVVSQLRRTWDQVSVWLGARRARRERESSFGRRGVYIEGR